jgi:hypothetical protein
MTWRSTIQIVERSVTSGTVPISMVAALSYGGVND